MNCGTCKHYYQAEKGDASGTCRRNPPTAFLVPVNIAPSVGQPQGSTGIAVQAYFPPVGPEVGCGSHVMRPAVN